MGFAYETNNVQQNAKKKIKDKNCDYLVLNHPFQKDLIFNSKYNNGGIFDRDGKFMKIEKTTKTSFANKIIKHILR